MCIMTAQAAPAHPDVNAKRRLLVLGAGRQQLGSLQAARRRGLLVVAVYRDSAAPPQDGGTCVLVAEAA
jgi:hypothetical protein